MTTSLRFSVQQFTVVKRHSGTSLEVWESYYKSHIRILRFKCSDQSGISPTFEEELIIYFLVIGLSGSKAGAALRPVPSRDLSELRLSPTVLKARQVPS